MSALKQYSTLFSTLYDEQCPIGTLGRGAHYSVLRATTNHGKYRKSSSRVNVQDIGLIWDEDHDERVIEALETLYVKDLLWPVQIIGERKGGLTTLVYPNFYHSDSRSDYEEQLEIICGSLHDPWTSTVSYFDPSMEICTEEQGILIHSDAERVDIYLKNIHSLWDLGIKKYKPTPTIPTFTQPSAMREQDHNIPF